MPEHVTEIGRLVAELIEMGRRDPNPETELYAAYLEKDKPRAREIGERLNEIGGHALMEQVHQTIVATAPPYSGRHLDFAWDGVGDWSA